MTPLWLVIAGWLAAAASVVAALALLVDLAQKGRHKRRDSLYWARGLVLICIVGTGGIVLVDWYRLHASGWEITLRIALANFMLLQLRPSYYFRKNRGHDDPH